MYLVCTQSPQMFHSYATPQRICITADKLRLNKLLRGSTHTSGIRLLSPQRGGFHLHMAYVLGVVS
jgi:hypothetical protein